MSEARDEIRAAIRRLENLAIEAAGADVASVTAEMDGKTDEQLAKASAEAMQVRDGIRAGLNLLGGFLVDVNRIADSLATLASPPAEHEPGRSGKWVWVETAEADAAGTAG